MRNSAFKSTGEEVVLPSVSSVLIWSKGWAYTWIKSSMLPLSIRCFLYPFSFFGNVEATGSTLTCVFWVSKSLTGGISFCSATFSRVLASFGPSPSFNALFSLVKALRSFSWEAISSSKVSSFSVFSSWVPDLTWVSDCFAFSSPTSSPSRCDLVRFFRRLLPIFSSSLSMVLLRCSFRLWNSSSLSSYSLIISDIEPLSPFSTGTSFLKAISSFS